MVTIDNRQIENLLEDIASIKSVINKNKPLIHQILMPRHFRLFSLIAGISVLVFCFLIYFLIAHYESYATIPKNIKGIIYGLMALDWMLLVFLKYSRWGKSLMKIDRTFTLGRAIDEFFSYRIMHVYFPLAAIMFILCFRIAKVDAYYIIPIISIGTGLLYNFIGSITEIRQWLVGGYWFLIAGIAILLADPIPATLALAVTMGCGCLLFAAVPSREV